MKLEYYGKVTDDNKLKLWNKELLVEDIKNLRGKNITLIIKESQRERSKKQLRYYWAVIVNGVQEGFIDLGTRLTKKQVHEYLKCEFLYDEQIDKNGKVYKIPLSLGDLGDVSIDRFNKFKEEVQQFASEYLSVYIPDPNEQLEIFENHDDKFFENGFLETVDEAQVDDCQRCNCVMSKEDEPEKYIECKKCREIKQN